MTPDRAGEDLRLVLYFAPGSSSMAPHIALRELDLPFEARPVSFARHEQRSDWFLTLNPVGKVPVLTMGSEVLTEVAAILYFLARTDPKSRLWPSANVWQQAEVVSWMSFTASTLHPARRQGIDAVNKAYTLANRKLANRQWVAGQYSIADIHLFRLYWRIRASVGIDLADFPALERHYQAMMARVAVQNTIAIERQVGYELPDHPS